MEKNNILKIISSILISLVCFGSFFCVYCIEFSIPLKAVLLTIFFVFGIGAIANIVSPSKDTRKEKFDSIQKQ
jgi:hypothetical protein